MVEKFRMKIPQLYYHLRTTLIPSKLQLQPIIIHHVSGISVSAPHEIVSSHIFWCSIHFAFCYTEPIPHTGHQLSSTQNNVIEMLQWKFVFFRLAITHSQVFCLVISMSGAKYTFLSRRILNFQQHNEWSEKIKGRARGIADIKLDLEVSAW